MLPQKYLEGKRLSVEKSITNRLVVVPDLQRSTIGARIRYLRRRQGLTIQDLERRTQVSHGTISRIERDSSGVNVAAVGRLVAFFSREIEEAFPNGQHAADILAPVSDFGSWLRNFRIRKGLQQAELAKILGVSRAAVCWYERNRSKPRDVIVNRLKKAFKLNTEFDRFL